MTFCAQNPAREPVLINKDTKGTQSQVKSVQSEYQNKTGGSTDLEIMCITTSSSFTRALRTNQRTDKSS